VNINLLPLDIAYEAESCLKDDLRLYGSGWLRLTKDGDRLRVEHVPFKSVVAETETSVSHPITATGPFRRKCHACEREHDSNLPPGIGASFCSHECAV
jgi:hypothetical protein